MLVTKVFLVNISLLLLTGVAMSGENLEMILDKKVGVVTLQLDGTSTIELKKSADDKIKLEDIKYKGTSHNPIKMFVDGNMVKIIQKAAENNFSVDYTLYVPVNKELTFSAGNLNLSGELSAKELKITSGNITVKGKFEIEDEVSISSGNADFSLVLNKCKRLKFTTGNATGKVHVPNGCKHSAPPFWSKLKIQELQ
ncbi:MAG: hypothetical protein HQK49_17325 [Oligoflexia bacterium]|nr:hypothetical protein [Oligoflexia bacterium]